jgi:8-oxo-dGTP diphosphatase
MSKRVVRVVAAVIERDGRYLITQRKETAVLPMLWEFPGGRVEEGESDEHALLRELEERLGVAAVVRERLGEHVHQYDRYDVHLTLFACMLSIDAEPSPRAVRDLKWVKSSEMAEYSFPPADQTTMDKLLGMGRPV